jgi:hypothetical protein
MFVKEDLLLLKGLKKVLEDATFPLKRREVAAFAAVIKWVDDLEKRIEMNMKPIEKPKKEKIK